MRVLEYALRVMPLLHICFIGDFQGAIIYTVIHMVVLIIAAQEEGIRAMTLFHTLSIVPLIALNLLGYEKKVMAYNLTMLSTLFALTLYYLYGEGDINKMKGKVETGPYKAGLKMLNLPEGNICYVYYPVDKDAKGEKDEIPYRLSIDNEDFCDRQDMLSWISGGRFPPQFCMRHEFQATIPVAFKAEIAKEFQSSKRQLVPLIFSHGMMSNSNINSVLLKELASYGILVVTISHHDGSNCGTRDHRTWNRVKFDMSKPLNDI